MPKGNQSPKDYWASAKDPIEHVMALSALLATNPAKIERCFHRRELAFIQESLQLFTKESETLPNGWQAIIILHSFFYHLTATPLGRVFYHNRKNKSQPSIHFSGFSTKQPLMDYSPSPIPAFLLSSDCIICQTPIKINPFDLAATKKIVNCSNCSASKKADFRTVLKAIITAKRLLLNGEIEKEGSKATFGKLTAAYVALWGFLYDESGEPKPYRPRYLLHPDFNKVSPDWLFELYYNEDIDLYSIGADVGQLIFDKNPELQVKNSKSKKLFKELQIKAGNPFRAFMAPWEGHLEILDFKVDSRLSVRA